MENLLISACLLGNKCKYNGDSNLLDCDLIDALRKKYRLIPVCPEMAGGLSCPREPCEIVAGRVVSAGGMECTEAYAKGADCALKLSGKFSCREALLKERSPSCGYNTVYDGSFSHTLVPGNGITAGILIKNGIKVFGETEINQLINN